MAESNDTRITPLLFKQVCQRDTLWRGTRLALVVGTLLLLINQGDALFRGEMPNLIKAVLTYFVPFGVSVWTSVSKDREAQRHHLQGHVQKGEKEAT